jgi:hypothetical protein
MLCGDELSAVAEMLPDITDSKPGTALTASSTTFAREPLSVAALRAALTLEVSPGSAWMENTAFREPDDKLTHTLLAELSAAPAIAFFNASATAAFKVASEESRRAKSIPAIVTLPKTLWVAPPRITRLSLTLTPVLHEVEHVDHDDQRDTLHSMSGTQGTVLHAMVSFSSDNASQAPPCFGGDFRPRERKDWPPPQVLSQSLHAPHSAKVQSSGAAAMQGEVSFITASQGAPLLCQGVTTSRWR